MLFYVNQIYDFSTVLELSIFFHCISTLEHSKCLCQISKNFEIWFSLQSGQRQSCFDLAQFGAHQKTTNRKSKIHIGPPMEEPSGDGDAIGAMHSECGRTMCLARFESKVSPICCFLLCTYGPLLQKKIRITHPHIS
jgi:hypothetical protein